MHLAPAALAQRQGDLFCLSDLHLGPQRPELTERFLRFCQEIPAGVSDLCILGDLFDFWVHRAQAQEEPQNCVLRALQAVRAEGIRVWLMPGNRDFALAPSVLAEFGIAALPDPTLLPGGIVLTHGDLLCTQDHRYLRFRRIIRNPLLLRLLRTLPYSVLLGIGRRLRRSSQKELQKKTFTMMQATDNGIAMAIRGEGVFASSSAPYRILVHGHTHQAIDEDLPALNAHRFVLSDWQTTGATLLRCSATGECALWHYPPR
ncbi:UDP-2,3-diacylglucosamine diphosphatase [Acidithiobacillus sp. AMEEHan]|uniref:UDP-2,3-diacylglucosamine diphosphatase n=1 Tax=Acidithiobacillus sp. AMEEHan TaxID=2994951 RepID=UPI0027E4BC40|nr:UDP-2,3-diacylglucosamine diphosphatase [Acidithiobacillus sp. AMEEHan]